MSGFFVPSENILTDGIIITGSDVNHIKNVLRKKPGDVLSVFGFSGKTYTCEISEITDEEIRLSILETKESESELKTRVCLYQGLPKADKFELIIQKCVELGVHEITPVINERSISRPDGKKLREKVIRWNRISESAAKQSGRGIIPEVKDARDFREALSEAGRSCDIVLMPYENAAGMKFAAECIKNACGKKVAVFIGPEGGFSEKEAELAEKAGAKIISLGHRILRTETAGLAVMSVLMFNEECNTPEG